MTPRHQRQLRPFALVVALLALPGVMLPACAGELRLGLVPENVFTSPAYAAEKLGYFKDAGLTVKFTIFRGGAAGQEAMSAGQADVIDYFGPAIALAISKGAKERIVATNMPGHTGWNVVVKANSPYKDIKDLAGKKVGITAKATTSDMAALWFAERAGITIQQVPVGPAALAPSVRSGQIDAFVFSAVVTNREILAGHARSLLPLTDVMPPTIADSYVASQDYMDHHAADLRAFLAATLKGLAYMKANRDWSLAFLKEFTKVDSDKLVALLLEEVLPRMPSDGRTQKEWVETGIKLAARAWEVPELAKVDAAIVFTNDFLSGGK